MKRYVHPRARGRVTYGSLAVGEQPRRLPTHACTLGPPPALKAERRLEPKGPVLGEGSHTEQDRHTTASLTCGVKTARLAAAQDTLGAARLGVG